MFVNMSLNAALAAALYGPLGIGGIVLGTVVGTIAMCGLQGWMLRGDLGGIEGARTAAAVARMSLAAAALAAVSYGAWYGLDGALGDGLAGQIVSVGGGIVAGFGVYAAAVWALRIPEARQFRSLLARRSG
jgi:putative peptidoglycan lipid II flippase